LQGADFVCQPLWLARQAPARQCAPVRICAICYGLQHAADVSELANLIVIINVLKTHIKQELNSSETSCDNLGEEIKNLNAKTKKM
jgi:hypothetical protein